MSTKHRATFYVQLKATRRQFGTNDKFGNRPIDSVKAVGITQSRPERPQAGCIVAKLTIEVPSTAFDPFEPEAIISIPESLLERDEIFLTALDPHV